MDDFKDPEPGSASQTPLDTAPGLFDMLRGSLADAAKRVPREWLDVDIKELPALTGWVPRGRDYELRYSLWGEYERAIQQNRPMHLSCIYTGITDRAGFQGLIQDPRRMAFLLNPPRKYNLRLEHLLDSGLERMEEMLSASAVTKTCDCATPCDCPKEVNTRLAALQFAATSHLIERVKGPLVKRIDQRVLQANVDVSQGQVINRSHPTKPEDIDRQIAELEKESKTLALAPGETMPGVIEVQYTPAQQEPVIIHGHRNEVGETALTATESRDPKETS